jgi:hypothetical protein
MALLGGRTRSVRSLATALCATLTAVGCAERGAVTITSTSPLPNGNADLAYSQALAARGGASPYSWSITSGALPSGLSLSSTGVIAGTPSAGGTSTFSVTVTAGAASNTKSFTLTVAHDVALTWTASTTSGVTYKVYRGIASGGPYTLIASGIASTSFTDTTVQSGQTYYYACTAINSAGESVYSPEQVAVVPNP